MHVPRDVFIDVPRKNFFRMPFSRFYGVWIRVMVTSWMGLWIFGLNILLLLLLLLLPLLLLPGMDQKRKNLNTLTQHTTVSRHYSIMIRGIRTYGELGSRMALQESYIDTQSSTGN